MYVKMGLPVVPGEPPKRTALKAYLSLMLEDGSFHNIISSLQKEHKSILLSFPTGGKPEGANRDPFNDFETELQIENAMKQSMERGNVHVMDFTKNQNEEVKKNDAKKTEAEAKKSVGAFSFLGSKDKQAEYVNEFLNRNKKKKDEAAPAPEDSQPATDSQKVNGVADEASKAHEEAPLVKVDPEVAKVQEDEKEPAKEDEKEPAKENEKEPAKEAEDNNEKADNDDKKGEENKDNKAKNEDKDAQPDKASDKVPDTSN